MKKRIFAIMMFLLALMPAIAQQHQANGNPQMPKFDPQEFTKRMEGYIAMKAGLTREESDKFFPIYREFKQKQRDLTFKQQRLKREKPANDKEYENVVIQIANLSVQIAKLEQIYFPRMCKVISAKKVYIVLQAENDFHRDLIMQPQWGGNQRGGAPQQQWGGQRGSNPQQQWGGQRGNNPQQWGGQRGNTPQQWGGQRGNNPQWGGNNGQQKKN